MEDLILTAVTEERDRAAAEHRADLPRQASLKDGGSVRLLSE